jgi:PKHD-type hydroxylase
MLTQVPNVLGTDDIQRCRLLLGAADWADGRITAGTQSAGVKNNRQLPETCEQLPELRERVLGGLQQNALFFAATLPRRIYPPLFNRYSGTANAFGNHVDNAMRSLPDGMGQLRTDLSCTLFLSDPDSYDGGELVIESALGLQRIKLPAGDAIVYPANTVHRVEPVTRGERLASFFWIESLVRENERRALLLDLDLSIMALRESQGDTAPVVRLTGVYHNLLRMWGSA